MLDTLIRVYICVCVEQNVSLTRIYVYFCIFMLFDIVKSFEHNRSTVLIFSLRILNFVLLEMSCFFLDYQELYFLCLSSCIILFLRELVTLVSEKHVCHPVKGYKFMTQNFFFNVEYLIMLTKRGPTWS